jgi:hypothetical protein
MDRMKYRALKSRRPIASGRKASRAERRSRHGQLPKLDVAGSIPVARSNGHRGLRRMP